MRSLLITLTIVILLIARISASAGDLKVETTSTDTSKQCTIGDSSMTKTGETDLTMKMEYELGVNFAPEDGIIIIDLPMRYHDYFYNDGGSSLITATSQESMVDSTLLSVYMIYDGTTYWPSLLLEEDQTTFTGSSGKDTKITATFATPVAATISIGSIIKVYINGIKNPPSNN